MNQNLLSRIFGAGSIYETLNEDAESSAGGYHNLAQSTYSQSQFGMSFHPYASSGKSRALDRDDEVPESIMYEAYAAGEGLDNGEGPSNKAHRHLGNKVLPARPYEISDSQQRPLAADPQHGRIANGDRDRVLYKWANVNNLDLFLSEVYKYFLGNGMYSILLNRVLNLLTVAFVTTFVTYFAHCIDYSKLRTSSSLHQVQVGQCMTTLSTWELTILWLIAFGWCIRLFGTVSDLRTLWEMHEFYLHLLNISETDMQTISWQEIVNRMLVLRDSNPSTASHNQHSTQSRESMDAHSIANRIMRKDNYLVAMINKEVIDTSVPLFGKRPLLTWLVEWNLSLCIFAYLFDERGQVRQAFVREPGPQKKALVDALRSRFRFAALLNLFIFPFISGYLLFRHFLTYFSEYHRNPAAIGMRGYTPYAQWKFREFNELQHIFNRRLTMSHDVANKYVSQFPNDKTAQLARFSRFVAGSFAAVLAFISIIDPDLFLGFEITHDRTVLFYLGFFGTIIAISQSLMPEKQETFDPESSLRAVIEFTHYSPENWQGQYHSHETKAEFCKLYEYKFVIFIEEILSAIAVPFILWFSLAACSEQIIDFVKDFSVHVDGVGYVCSFALFDFEANGDAKYGAPISDKATPNRTAKEGKMEKSFLNFKASNPDWVPELSGSHFLQNLQTQTKVASSNHVMPSGIAPVSALPPAFGPRSPYKSSRKVLAGDTYATQSSRARRGLDMSMNMAGTLYNPMPRPSRIKEETDRDLLNDSFLTTTQKSPTCPETKLVTENMVSTSMEIDGAEHNDDLEKLIQSIDSSQPSTITNLTKQIPRIRTNLTNTVLRDSIKKHLPSATSLLKAVEGSNISTLEKCDDIVLQAYFGVLAQVYLLDANNLEAGFALSKALVSSLRSLNARKLDPIAAKIYYYFAHFAELLDKSQDIRSSLLECQRTATLRHDKFSLATLITLLLRNHLLVNDVSGADKLISKTTFPSTAPNAIIARYLYYLAKVRAIQLDYSSANEFLTNAIRKVDATPATAGFLQAVHKLNVIVQLLIGEIPEKEDMKANYLDKALAPYSELVNAVRKGDLAEFGKVVDMHSSQFKKDGTASLIGRLRNNVLKTGIRSISLSYSRISLKDICIKLGLKSEESAEYIISKAIHENIISATLNHESAELLSNLPVDIYSSDVPQKGFHDRIKFCLELRNESVRAMRFPEDTGRQAINEIEEERRRIEESFMGDEEDPDEL
ncbi:Autophagy-related protein 9 [Taphrina deformans PYCC 5710]|uniref:Autophagy-related protein 9 n=1 Tax=Taphrina deformans (strain PYCC 5710 / ATCC 11124 / CBS 356.35 / IMI 108563 / JCM 9778 / NBRC 8474) TaxID=1097556 RepID=R4X6T9_TAPDE|nr:Autophagy-related protein 9 [Taphrina deformans PYCC 5710]|eukprot:CCG80926.1 Autophagy-related protein 9 [Taphrina deformans PYCC 5710]